MTRKRTGKERAHPKPGRLRRAAKVLVKALVAAAVVSACALLGYYVQGCALLSVRTIGIRGANVLNEYDIARASGITRKDNLLLLDTGAVRERILAMPYVKSCEVRRFFPDVVLIDIKERTPVATIVSRNRACVIDADLVVLGPLADDAAPCGPYISEVPGLGSVEPGQQLDSLLPLKEAIAVWAAFATTKMSKEVTVSEIAAYAVNDIRMYCDELPYEVRWGRGAFDVQARRLDVLWEEKKGKIECKEYLDLRFGRDLACR